MPSLLSQLAISRLKTDTRVIENKITYFSLKLEFLFSVMRFALKLIATNLILQLKCLVVLS